MKLGVFTVMLPDMSPEQAAAALAEVGYQGVEWRVKTIEPEFSQEAPSFWRNNYCTLQLTDEDARRARRLADESSLEIAALGTYVEADDLEMAEQAMRVAQIAGVKQLRIGTGRTTTGKSYTELFARAHEFWGKIEQLARQYGVRALAETHPNTITPSASLAHRLLSAFDPEYVGVIYDIGNLFFEGYEKFDMALDLLGPYLAHVHIKNARFVRPDVGSVWQAEASPFGDGVVDFDAAFAALHRAGYDQWVMVEDFSKAHPSRELLEYDFNYLHPYLRRVSEISQG